MSLAPVRDSLTVQYKGEAAEFEVLRSTTYAELEATCLARFGLRPRAGAVVDIVVVDVEDNEEIGWLSRSTFRPLATHHRMTLEGLDGFVYELRIDGAVDRVQFVKRSASMPSPPTSPVKKPAAKRTNGGADDHDHDDQDEDDEAEAFGLDTLDLSALKGKLPALELSKVRPTDDDDDDDGDNVSASDSDATDDRDSAAVAPAVDEGAAKLLQRKKAFQSLPNKGPSAASSRIAKSVSNVGSVGSGKSGAKASLFDVFAGLDNDAAAAAPPPLPLSKSGSMLSLSGGAPLRKAKTATDQISFIDKPLAAAAAEEASASGSAPKKKKKKSASSRHGDASVTTSRSSRSQAPASPRGHGRGLSPRRQASDVYVSPRSPRSAAAPHSHRSPRAVSPRSRSPRSRSPRSRSPRGERSARGTSPRRTSHATSDNNDNSDNDLHNESDDEPTTARAQLVSSGSDIGSNNNLPLVGGSPIGAGTLIDVTKLRAGKALKAPDTKGDVGQAARTHLVTTRADGTKSLSAIPGSISPLDKDRADELLYGSLLKGQPKHRAKAKKGFFHRAGRSSKRQGRFSRQLVAAHPEASFVAVDGSNDAVEVSAAPLVLLVELLSHPREHDDTFEDHFLLTFNSFATPVELLEALVKRFVAHTPVETPTNALVRERILQFTMRWMQARDDFATDEALGVVLVDFLSASLEKQSKASETKMLTEVFNLFKAKIAAAVEGSAPSTGTKPHPQQQQAAAAAAAAASASTADDKAAAAAAASAVSPRKAKKKPKKSSAVFKEPPPIPFLPINMSYRSTGLSFFDLHPVEIARQMTLLEHQAFLATSLDEWCAAQWQSSIGLVIMRFNDMSRWVSTELVTADTVEYRALLVRRFIVIASTCLSLNNFNGVMEVLSGLQAPSVQRLKATWKALSGEASKTYKALADLMSLEAKNVPKYRERMEQAAAPCVPYIGFYVAELSTLEENAPTYFEDGRINVAKQAAKIPVLSTIRMLQTEGRDERFNLVPIGFIQDFLLQQTATGAHALSAAPLLNDEDLMANSLKREPEGGGSDAAAAAAAAPASDESSKKSKRK